MRASTIEKIRALALDGRGDPNIRKVAIAKLAALGISIAAGPARTCRSKRYRDWANWQRTPKGNLSIVVPMAAKQEVLTIILIRSTRNRFGWLIINRVTGCQMRSTAWFATAELAADSAWDIREYV